MDNNKLRDFAMLGVPAIIALAMVAAVIYMSVWTDKAVPDFFVNSLTTILGYYFGIGVTASLNGNSQRQQAPQQPTTQLPPGGQGSQP